MSNFTVVVIAMPQVAEALARSGQFASVEAVASTGGLRDLLRSGTMTPGAADKVFLFSDATPVDTPQSLDYLIQQMTGMKARVIVVATSPAGEALVAAVPSAGLVKGALRINTVLGAIGGMAVPVSPVGSDENLPLDPALTAGPLPTAARPAAPANPFGGGAPANPFGEPAQPMAQSAAQPVIEPPSQPAPASPAAANPFAGAQTSPASAPASPFGAPAPAAESAMPDANPFGAPIQADTAPAANPVARPAANPFSAGAPATEPSASAGPAANPFGASASADAPATANPFSAGAPAPEPSAPSSPAANPFGGSGSADAPAAANPFRAPATTTPVQSPFEAPVTAPAPTGGSPFGAAPRPGAPVARPGVAEESTRPARRGYVITITSPKGGTGKSSMSLNLAAYLGLRTQGQRTVALIDANVQQADAGKYLNAWTPNIEDLGKDPSAIHPDRIGQHLLHRQELNLSVLLGPATPDVAFPVYYTGKKYAQILEAMRPNYDYIIIDTPVAEFYHDMFREFALPCADFVLVTIAPNYTTLMNTDAWLRQVCAPKQSGGMGVDPAKVGVVLNRAEEEIGFSEVEVMRDLNEWRYLGAIPETKEWKRANNEGQLVATQNYAELNEAFSNILYQATGEELLRTGPTNLPSASSSLGDKLKAMFTKRKKG